MKHKKLTMIVALVLVAALAAGLGIWATGEENIPTVTYYDGSDGTNAHFTFTHTGKGSDTNLFPNFSDCMPGDSLTQTIRVQADSKNGAQGAKIYLRAEIDGDASAKEGSAITYNDVLDHISMTVSKNGVVLASNKTAKLFSQLDASQGLKSNVFIAEVSPKTDPVDLDVTIEVDPAMGNAFQEAAAHIAFVFSVEDNEVPPPPLEREKHDAYIVGYPNGNVGPNDNITRAEVATIFYRLLQDDAREQVWCTTYPYPDVEANSWYSNQVATLTNAGILAGFPGRQIRPARAHHPCGVCHDRGAVLPRAGGRGRCVLRYLRQLGARVHQPRGGPWPGQRACRTARSARMRRSPAPRSWRSSTTSCSARRTRITSSPTWSPGRTTATPTPGTMSPCRKPPTATITSA